VGKGRCRVDSESFKCIHTHTTREEEDINKLSHFHAYTWTKPSNFKPFLPDGFDRTCDYYDALSLGWGADVQVGEMGTVTRI
jgi:hypothetical protein